MSWLNGWSYRTPITISDANVSEDLTGCTVLISNAADEDVGAGVFDQQHGGDVRFTAADGCTPLYYERAAFVIDSGAATYMFYVLVPSVSCTSDTTIYMYYGNEFAEDGSDPGSAWDAARVAVFHFQDAGQQTIADSTGGNDLSPDYISSTTGLNGVAAAFDGSSSVGCNPYPSNMPLGNSARTISALVRFDDMPSSSPYALIDFGYFTGIQESCLDLSDSHYGEAGHNIAFHDCNDDRYDGDHECTTATWYYVSFTYDGDGGGKFYLNGDPGASVTFSITLDTSLDAYGLLIGANNTAGLGWYFYGAMNEARIDDVARSAGWQAFEAANLLNEAHELSFASREEAPAGGGSSPLLQRVLRRVACELPPPPPASRVINPPSDASCSSGFQSVFRRVACELPARPAPSRVINPARFRWRHTATLRGLYRIFNAPEYRCYFSASGAPAESDTPYATSSALPATPPNTFADGTYYFSLSYFDGVLDSGFLPLGPHGETYLRLDIAAGVPAGAPPLGPATWSLRNLAGGVVRVVGCVFGSDASQWAIRYTSDGTTPGAHGTGLGTSINLDFVGTALVILSTTLPAAADDAVVKVRLETRRNDGTALAPLWVYSASSVQSVVADAQGPAAAPVAVDWPGRLPTVI